MELNLFGFKIRISPSTELKDIKQTQQTILMKVSEAIELIEETRKQLIKAKGEILGKIAQLENADGDLTPEQAKIVGELRQTVQGVDDIIPDKPGNPPTEDELKQGAEDPNKPATETGAGGGEPPKQEGGGEG